jgi:1,4-alpha-glucan branching enzyme
MWAHPGKKLLFMGNELGQWAEWNHDSEIDWALLDHPAHRGLHRLVRDLNRHYAEQHALHQRDADPGGFRWMVGDDTTNSVFAFMRFGAPETPPVLVVCNMTPVPRPGYRIGVPRAGWWRELLNSDSAFYGGSDMGNGGGLHATPVPSHGENQSLDLLLPPLATLLLQAGA